MFGRKVPMVGVKAFRARERSEQLCFITNMGKISQKRRQFEIRRKRERRKKIKKLKERYLAAKSKEEKERIIKKIKRIAPHLRINLLENKD